jgi:hypothetical protein
MQIRQQDVSFTRNGLKKTEDSVIWSVQFLEVTLRKVPASASINNPPSGLLIGSFKAEKVITGTLTENSAARCLLHQKWLEENGRLSHLVSSIS